MTDDGHHSEDDHCGSSIMWTVINMTHGDLGNFIRELKDEIHSHPEALRECSRWAHRMMDNAQYTIEAVKGFVKFSSCVDSQDQFIIAMSTFVSEVDRNLGISAGHPVETDLDGGTIKKRLGLAGEFAKKFRATLDILGKGLLQTLPESVQDSVQSRQIVDLSLDPSTDIS